MKKYAVLCALIVVLVALLPANESPAQAQGGGAKPVPIDSYPLPSAPGAARYSVVDRWNKTDLTFHFEDCPSTVDCVTAQNAVREAFAAWDNVSALTFQELATATADIEVQWTLEPDEFGTRGDVLAFAYFPSYGGDLYLDDAERWTFHGGDTDLYITSMHEIGHALGLDHSDDQGAVMFPYLIETTGLSQDDIDGIQRLYGPNTGTGPGVVVPATPDSLPSSPTTERVEGDIDNSQYYQLWTVDAHAGETITITMEALNGDLDPYLGLLTPDRQTVLAEDDDGLQAGGTSARITYTFPTAEDYVIVATRYDYARGTTRGDYRLTAYRGQAAAPVAPTATPVRNVSLFVTNYSGVVLCGVYITPSTSDDWGPDQLPSLGLDRINDNRYATWQVPAGTYDVLVMDCFDNTLETYLIDVAQDTEVQVYEDRLVVAR